MELMSNENTKHHYLNAGEIGDVLGVRATTICRVAKQGHIPKLILPNGRFLFDPDAVIDALRKTNGGRRDD